MLSPDKIDLSVLRAADIRGIAGRTLDSQTAELIGKAFGTILIRLGEKSVFVGRDGRQSSPELAQSLINGLQSCGLSVISIGLCPTPMLYFACQSTPISCGVMVTASHNPKEYNGFKFVLNGKLFFGENIKALGRIIKRSDFETGIGSLTTMDLKPNYINRLLADYQAGQRDLKIVWDCSNGTAAEIVPYLTRHLRGTHILMNYLVDGSFPAHAPDASNANDLRCLQSRVLAEKADLGIAFDGDSDRLGVFDATGKFIYTDHLLPILAEPILKKRPNAVVVGDIKISKSFSTEIKKAGGQPVITKTGHSYIKEKMIQTGALLGGERSGHICFADTYYGYDDALYAAVRLINIAEFCNIQKRFDDIPATFSTPELKFNVPDNKKFAKIALGKKLLAQEGICFDSTDGIKVLKQTGGWWLLRASNTTPALIGICEADTAEELAFLTHELMDFAARLGN